MTEEHTHISDTEQAIVSEFTNELGNLIKITIEGPTSTSENTLTKLEANALRDLLFQKLGIPEIANPAGETIRPAQGGAMEAAPVTGEQPVGAASPPLTEEAKHTPTRHPWTAYWDNDGAPGREYSVREKDDKGQYRAIAWDLSKADADIIVKAVNSYAELATLRTKLESAEKALEPFARAAQEEDGSERLEWRWHDDNELVESTAALVELTAGDFRKARSAISSIRGEQP